MGLADAISWPRDWPRVGASRPGVLPSNPIGEGNAMSDEGLSPEELEKVRKDAERIARDGEAGDKPGNGMMG